ncbi:peroxidase 43-like [Wolffia australiana]
MSRLIVLSVIVLLGSLRYCQGQLNVNFYNSSCPNAEGVVKSAVARAFESSPAIAAQLLRLQFHYCIVDVGYSVFCRFLPADLQGCDGSILINLPDGQQENKAFGHQGLGGFNVIDEARAQLESQCPGVVSCADIVALAATDSVFLVLSLSSLFLSLSLSLSLSLFSLSLSLSLYPSSKHYLISLNWRAQTKGPFYEVETGRLDGFSSSISHASDLPGEDEPVRSLQNKFLAKGLSNKDLVLLSAAHTIGTTACFFMGVRLNNFQGTRRPDPSIAPPFLAKLQGICPNGGDVNVRLALDNGSENVFDNHYFANVRARNDVLQSDASLLNHPTTRAFVDFYARFPNNFRRDFGTSMVKLGRFGVLTCSNGNIRKNRQESLPWAVLEAGTADATIATVGAVAISIYDATAVATAADASIAAADVIYCPALSMHQTHRWSPLVHLAPAHACAHCTRA